MITASDLSWDDVVRVGPGTLGGNYLRRFWWPVALSEEVKDIPVPVKALGEELVLFRDISGHPTLLGRHCSHRRASLEYGRIEAARYSLRLPWLVLRPARKNRRSSGRTHQDRAQHPPSVVSR